jgi:DTW domain-containing protein YfiP
VFLTRIGLPDLLASMGRSVILKGSHRCERCRFAPRWCICAGFQMIESPLQVDVLIHRREFHRPTSTGRLINRVIPASRQHVFTRETPPAPESIVQPGRTLWILHPRGDVMPTDASPADLQVLLIDGSWREAARMAQTVAPWGRMVRLPETGLTRNHLRDQENEGNYSTVESLMFLFAALGLKDAEMKLRLQFELHVYAGLRGRGQKDKAEAFLATSPAREAFPELLAAMNTTRPNYGTF